MPFCTLKNSKKAVITFNRAHIEKQKNLVFQDLTSKLVLSLMEELPDCPVVKTCTLMIFKIPINEPVCQQMAKKEKRKKEKRKATIMNGLRDF